MTPPASSSKRTKVHTRYRNAAGSVVPGVTTITGVLDKPALMHWAWQCGIDGLDYKEVRDEAADIGTIAHEMLMCQFKGIEFDATEYPEDLIKAALNSVKKYHTWAKPYTIVPLQVESQLVSEKLQVGGCPDLYCMIDGEYVLIDFKTGKGLYEEHTIQVAAYVYLLKEHGFPIKHARILRIGRTEEEGFEEKVLQPTTLTMALKIFKACQVIYEGRKALKKVK